MYLSLFVDKGGRSFSLRPFPSYEIGGQSGPMQFYRSSDVSIHAPARDATRAESALDHPDGVSIHASRAGRDLPARNSFILLDLSTRFRELPLDNASLVALLFLACS